MSERGSFVTEYMYCDRCFEAAKTVLLRREKYLCSVAIPTWAGMSVDELPIIAGKVGGLYSGEEVHTFEDALAPQLAEVICHPLTIAVIPENGQPTFVVVQPEHPSHAPGG